MKEDRTAAAGPASPGIQGRSGAPSTASCWIQAEVFWRSDGASGSSHGANRSSRVCRYRYHLYHHHHYHLYHHHLCHHHLYHHHHLPDVQPCEGRVGEGGVGGDQEVSLQAEVAGQRRHVVPVLGVQAVQTELEILI